MMDTRNKHYILVVVVVIGILLVFGSGIFILQNHVAKSTDTQQLRDLKFNIPAGTTFTYDLIYQNYNPDGIVHSGITMVAVKSNSGLLTLNSSIDNCDDGGATEHLNYAYTVEPTGNLINNSSGSPIVLEIRPELPNNLVFAKTPVKKGDTWVRTFDKNLTMNDSVTSILGLTRYTYDGLQNVSTKAGNFTCAIIRSNTTYNMNSTSEAKTNPQISHITATYDGIDYIDVNSGCTIKTKYHTVKHVSINLSNVYYGLIKNLVQTDVFETDVEGELTNVA